MKQIEPILIWKNGESFEANFLNACITRDNMKDFAEFYYYVCNIGQGTEEMPLVIGQILSEGNITMSEDIYLDWDNSNESAYEYIAQKLNLTLIKNL